MSLLDDDFYSDIPDDILFELERGLEKEKRDEDDSWWSNLPPLSTAELQFEESDPLNLNLAASQNILSLSGFLKNSNANFPSSDNYDPSVIPSTSNVPDPNSFEGFESIPFDPSLAFSQDLSQSSNSPSQNSQKSEVIVPTPSKRSTRKTKASKENSNNNNNIRSNSQEDSPPISLDLVSPAYQSIVSELNNTEAEYVQQEKEIFDAENQQKDLKVSDTVLFSKLQKIYFEISNRIMNELNNLRKMLSQQVLQPAELSHLNALTSSLQMQKLRLGVLGKELSSIASESNNSMGVANLFIAEQGPGQVVFKGRPIDTPFVVKLVRSSKMPKIEVSSVTARIADDSWKAEKGAQPLENHIAEVFNEQHRGVFAEFKELKLNLSTRMAPLYLEFSMLITEHIAPKEGEKARKPREVRAFSNAKSTPIIVITNESQWPEAAYRLLEADIYGESANEVPWAFFCNILHRHVLNHTVQTRALKNWEFNYIHTRYFGKGAKAMRDQTKNCWNWLGHVITTIKFKRHIKSMWEKGLIFGLISKMDCKSWLQNLGDFLIRFSDSAPGSFAIAYVTDDPKERIKHYLVRPKDIGSTKSLPDFIHEKSQFKTIVKVNHNFEMLSTSKVPKEMELSSFIKTKVEKHGREVSKGYVDNLES